VDASRFEEKDFFFGVWVDNGDLFDFNADWLGDVVEDFEGDCGENCGDDEEIARVVH
jgi:hypothetical protein